MTQGLRRSIALLMLGLLLIAGAAPANAESGPIKLSGKLFSAATNKMSVTPDGSHVVFVVTTGGGGEGGRLYSAPIDGSAPPLLLSALFASDEMAITTFRIAPDSSYVVYQVTNLSTDELNLFSAPLSGGGPVQLNPPMPVTNHVSDFAISPDSSRVVYRADQVTDEIWNLYSVPLAGGRTRKLNGPLIADGDVARFAISPDSSRVVYTANQLTDEALELFSAPMSGGPATKLSLPLDAGGTVRYDAFAISSDNSRVVYVAHTNADRISELYSVPLASGLSTKLNGALAVGGDVAYTFWLSPDGSRAVYLASLADHQEMFGLFELYSVPIAGGASTILSTLEVDPNDFDFAISPDSSYAVYRASEDGSLQRELYSVPLVGGSPTKLNGPLVAGGTVQRFGLTADGSRAIYHADQDADEVLELYSVPLAGGGPTKLNGRLVAGGDVQQFTLSPMAAALSTAPTRGSTTPTPSSPPPRGRRAPLRSMGRPASPRAPTRPRPTHRTATARSPATPLRRRSARGRGDSSAVAGPA